MLIALFHSSTSNIISLNNARSFALINTNTTMIFTHLPSPFRSISCSRLVLPFPKLQNDSARDRPPPNRSMW